MELQPLPSIATWELRSPMPGFEVAVSQREATGHGFTGHSTAQSGRRRWSVGYDIQVDAAWRTEVARLMTLWVAGERVVTLIRDDAGWSVDGIRRPDLEGCLDVGFEFSVLPHTLPLHRLDFRRGIAVEVPVAFVRGDDLLVHRHQQRFTLLDRAAGYLTFRHVSETFGFEHEVRFDAAGLIVDYPYCRPPLVNRAGVLAQVRPRRCRRW